MEQTETTFVKTPLGTAKIMGNKKGLQSISVLDQEVPISKTIPEHHKDCVLQLEEYFQGTRQQFDLLLNPKGTAFQKKVWNTLLQIPFGKTKSYREQANTIGDPKAIRAVAAANGKNPLWIVIPCHRIIGSDGSLTGYAGGIWRKKWLLDHESPIKQETLF